MTNNCKSFKCSDVTVCDYCGDESGCSHYVIGDYLVRPNGEAMLAIERHTADGSGISLFSTGYCINEGIAKDFAESLLKLKDEEIMKLLKNDKLFPHIKGVMLKEKRITLHMSGKANIITVKGGKGRPDSYKSEIFFSDRKKTAMLNENQTLLIISVYGDDTDDWKGKPLVLYGEEGDWFGTHQWALRVDEEMTQNAYEHWRRNQPHQAPAIDEKESVAESFDERLEQEREDMAEQYTDEGMLPFDLPEAETGAYAD